MAEDSLPGAVSPRAWRLLALALLLGGLAAFGYAVLTGEARVGFVLVFPILLGSGLVAAVGMLLLMGAAVAWFLGVAAAAATPPEEGAWSRDVARGGAEEGRARHSRGGGVVLIGPIPVVWGSDPRAALWLVVATIVLIVVVVAVLFFL